jgi:hypothetical protein
VRKWKAVMHKDRPSGLAGDTGVERWTVLEDLGPKYPSDMGGAIVMHGKKGKDNAHFIASAPQLLEASEALLNKEQEMTTGALYLEFRQLEEAVKKAKGETT